MVADDIRKSLDSISSMLSQSKGVGTTNNHGSSPSMTAMATTSTSHHHQQQQQQQLLQHGYQYNNNNNNNIIGGSNDYMTLHSPSLSTVGDSRYGGLLSPSTPGTQATQATLPSGMPGGSRYIPQQQQQIMMSSGGGEQQNYNTHHRNSSSGVNSSGGRQYSETSSSICNFSNTTPYQIHTTTAAMNSTTGGSSLPFDSSGSVGGAGGGGAVIGSPLSAFSAVRSSTSGVIGSGGQGLIRGGTTTAAGATTAHRGGGGRETMSLLVSPPTSRIDDTTSTASTLANQNSSTAARIETTVTTPKDDKRYQHYHHSNNHHHDDDEIINPNPNAKDPTPYQNRVAANKEYGGRTAKPSSTSYHQNHHHSDRSHQQHQHHHSDRSQQQHHQQQREGYDNANNKLAAAASSSSSSSTTSRSIDPPAKSPFGSIITSTSSSHHHTGGGGGGGTSGSGAYHRIRESLQRNGGGGYQDHHHQQPTQHSHPITELSIIEEDENHHHHHNVYNNLNSSSTSTVTGFTLPRTPVLREVQNSHHNHSSSGGSGSRSGNNNNVGGGGSVAFAHNLSTPGANSITGGKSFTSLTGGGGGAYSTEKLLHRPSAAMRDSFQQLASQTAHQLEDIWDIVGIVPEERASQLADLVDRIASLCHEKIEQEEQLAEQFRKEIAEARYEWEECCTVLRIEEEDPVVKMKRDPSVGGGSGVGVSLQSEYEVMMSRLESIRLVREKATEDIVSSQRRIYEAYAALSGCTVEEVATSSAEMEAWADTSSNLTEEQRELFRSKAVDYEESVSSRTQAIVSLLVDCQNLIRELEIVPPGCDGKDENDTDGYVGVGQNEDDVKIMNSLKSIQRSDTNKDGNSGDGGGGGKRPRSRGKSSDSYTVKSLFETPSCVGIGKDVLDRLTSRIAELNGEKRQRRKKLGEMGSAIASLWSLLRIPSEEQRAFTDNISGLGMDTLQKGERELDRLNELKAVMIGKLIREQRQTIEELWERTNATEGEKATFDRYFYINDEDQLTDDLLAKHEEYAGSLNAKLEKMQPILDLIERRESIIEERVELEMLQRDPDRLKGRNASKQLMKEEKMMRRVQKELPKITQHLERKLKEWFDENKPSQTEGEVRDEDLGHFMYKGLPYLRTMKIQEHEWKTRKERGEQERQRKRQEERSNSSGSAFGSSYSKLPGKKSSKWNPPAASNSRPRSASNMRPASRGLRPGDMNRVNRPPAGEKSTKPGATTKSSGYGARAASAPRMRF